MKGLQKYIIAKSETIRNGIKKMDEGRTNFLVVLDGRHVVGVITEGDIRKAILSGLDLQDAVSTIANRDYKYLALGYSKEDARRKFKSRNITHVPVLENGKLAGIIERKAVLKKDHREGTRRLLPEVPAVIMAGGKGTRLDPFTRILPKPLIPVGNDPLIKVIMDEFGKFGVHKFVVALNDKAKMVKAYFHDYAEGRKIQYIEEKKPLGTAGALKFLERQIRTAFFVSNCDIIVHADYASFYDFHKKGDYALTLVASMHQFTVPYGVCETDSSGALKDMREKPGYDFLVNTGFYMLEPSVFKLIPKNTYFDMTDLIKAVKAKGLKVGVYPVSEKSWMDLGQWVGYNNMLNDLEQAK